MLVLRYFGYVGGSLLALLFVCNAVVPKQPLPDVLSSNPEQPAIRIHSDKKWPERVVFDTSMAPVAAPAPVAIAQAGTPASPRMEAPSITAKSRVREAFAQFSPAEPKQEQKADLKTQAQPQVQAQPQPKRKVVTKVTKVAKLHVGRPLVLASQQPRFGWFDSTW
ncbi:hypothetical protein [Bradyrhizobium sp.]|uniref:hypothetical protein n=1 Tax=Bradyrhizobium sp. TaxID=376 RepID=UPI0025C73224|nr:hypothetical protein [Bradyrhizobium sp.]MBV8917158.1 hypothetical protein [Bradyrhizobium sp.]